MNRLASGWLVLGVLVASCGPEAPLATIGVGGSLTDPNDLAGLVVGIDGNEYRAGEFDGEGQLRIEFPESGTLELRVALVQGGEVVAQGVQTLEMRRDMLWYIGITRGVDPPLACVPCVGPEGYEIAEDAQSETGEQLWVSVDAFRRDNDGIVY